MEKLIIVVILFIAGFNYLVFMRYSEPIKKLDTNQDYFYNLVTSKVPYSKIVTEKYNIKVINCNGPLTYKCVLNKYQYMYDVNGNLIKHTLFYFVSSVLTFDITLPDWYKDQKNLKELLNKTNMLYLIPLNNNELGEFMYILKKMNLDNDQVKLNDFVYEYINKYK